MTPRYFNGRSPRMLLALPLALLWAWAAAASAQTPAPDPIDSVLSRLLADGRHAQLPALDMKSYWPQLRAVYTEQPGPRWMSDCQASARGLGLIGILRAAENVGLRSADYEANRLPFLLRNLSVTGAATELDCAALDVGMTAAALAYAHDLHFGRVDPRAAGTAITIERARLDLAGFVSELSRSDDMTATLRTIEPPFVHYELLKGQLAKYRELSFIHGLTGLPELRVRSVKPGEPYEGMAQLRRLLGALGDLADPEPAPHVAEPGVLDAATSQALRRFQRRHGLEADAALGKSTWRALTTPLSARARQIELTLERWRWLPPAISTPPIIINIPQFRLFAFRTTLDREADLLAMDVIVGRAYRNTRTPVFTADLKYLVLHPYWDVPASILQGEFMPSIRTDPQFLERNQLEIVAGPSDDSPVVALNEQSIERLARGELRLRQRPGPGNSLGLAKFMMPNVYNVYLHGTPAQGLFARPSRAYSHGCVRVADPLALAQFVLRDQPEWPRERIEQAMQGPVPTRVTLRQPLRVFVLYGTAVATESGNLLFFEDIYGHDARLDRLLRAGR